MSAPASCVRCVDMNLQCIFPEDSEQCRQCQDSQVRCDGSTSDEEYQQVKDELQKIQEKMDAILEQTIPNSGVFRKMKHQHNLLESKKRSIRLNKQSSNNHKMEEQILAAERQLLRGLQQFRNQRLPEHSEYQALLEKRAALQEREDEIMQRWDTWINEVLEKTDYSHYRGLPMPENLNEEQWKDALAWAQTYPGSHRMYPDPSSICGDSESDDEVMQTHENRIRAEFRHVLQGFYPLFDTLVKDELEANTIQKLRKQDDALSANDNTCRISSDIICLETGIKLLKAHVDQMKMALKFADNNPPTSMAVSVAKQFLHIWQNLSSVLASCIEENVLIPASEESAKATEEQKKQLQYGINEVERFLSKLYSGTLLFPKEGLDLQQGRDIAQIDKSHIFGDHDMDIC